LPTCTLSFGVRNTQRITNRDIYHPEVPTKLDSLSKGGSFGNSFTGSVVAPSLDIADCFTIIFFIIDKNGTPITMIRTTKKVINFSYSQIITPLKL
jgi:hypothetical protein